MRKSLVSLFPVVLLSLGAQLVANQSAEASTWNFASGGNYYVTNGSSYGNRITFTSGTDQLIAKAWSNTASDPDVGFESAFIRRFQGGIGVCNPGEGMLSACVTGGIDHQVDNVSQNDVVLFLFSSPQALQSLTVDPSGTWDRDLSFWVGNVSAGVSLTGQSFATLGSLGFGAQMDLLNTPSDDSLTVSLGGLVGNALLVSALYPADNDADKFKIRALQTTVVPVPAALGLFLAALVSLVGVRRQLKQTKIS